MGDTRNQSIFIGDCVSAAKYFFWGGTALFATVGLVGYWRRPASAPLQEEATVEIVQEIVLPKMEAPKRNLIADAPSPVSTPVPAELAVMTEDLPDADCIAQLFATDSSRLPIVETVAYTSRVPWIQGRPAWIADYASYYNTSRHFIARSLNRKPDYLTQKVSPGNRFNVFKKDKHIQFHLLIDLSRCRLWFYCLDLDQKERILLKTYRIGVGRQDQKRKSGFLTPIGKYSLGEKVAIYKPGTMGFYQDVKVEMVRIFGTRWLPFEKEIDGCTESAKGLGLHGAPWIEDLETHELKEDLDTISCYNSDGCIRLSAADMEEIFAIVITKPTVVELVKDFRDAKLSIEGI